MQMQARSKLRLKLMQRDILPKGESKSENRKTMLNNTSAWLETFPSIDNNPSLPKSPVLKKRIV